MEHDGDLFLRACRGERVPRPPVWIMRQAGRYLPEYREVRKKVDFLTLCRTPELAAQVTIQPVDRLGVDDLAQGARDGRCRHEQHMWGTTLARQHGTLDDTEAMLLVDDGQAEVGEPDRVLHEGVGADDDQAARPSASRGRDGRAKQLDRFAALRSRQRPRKQRHVMAERLQQSRQCLRVLARQKVRWREQRALMTGVGREDER